MKRINGTSLARFLSSQRNGTTALNTVIMWPFVAFHSQAEVQLVADALKDHPSLQALAWMNTLFLRGYNNEHRITLDPILLALKTIPTLNNLQFSAGVNMGKGVRTSVIEDIQSVCYLLKKLCNLKYLSLRNFGLSDEACQAIAVTLTEQKHYTSLEVLNLRFNRITCHGYRAMYNMLQDNYMLQWLEMDDLDVEEITNEEIQQVIILLRANSAGRKTLLKKRVSYPRRLHRRCH